MAFADPDYDLAVDWIAARDAIKRAQERHDDTTVPPGILLISSSARSEREHICPGEMSKSYRLVQVAREVLAAAGQISPEVRHEGAPRRAVPRKTWCGRRRQTGPVGHRGAPARRLAVHARPVKRSSTREERPKRPPAETPT